MTTCPLCRGRHGSQDCPTLERPQLRCAGCKLTPAQLVCYQVMLLGEPDEDGNQEQLYPSEDAFVWSQEGTLNRRTGLFLCDDCYIKAGMPAGPNGWVVPDGTDVGTPEEWERDNR